MDGKETDFMAKTRYEVTDGGGFSIRGGTDVFNRILYGSHKNDDKKEKFVTFAGDTPQFLGALATWEKEEWCTYAKCGTLNSGLALTPGQSFAWPSNPKYVDNSSRWFHTSEDVVAEFKNGWMEYKLTHMSAYFPDVKVSLEAYPLLPDDGFLVHYHITTDQRCIFFASFGGLTGYPVNDWQYRATPGRVFHANECEKNCIKIGDNRASLRGPEGNVMHIATSFPAKFELGSAYSLEYDKPSEFLGSEPKNDDDKVLKLSAVIDAGQELDGFIIVLHNEDEKTLDKWLNEKNPIRKVKQHIYEKFACINVNTPEKYLDATIAPTAIALDASWHKDVFQHGTFHYHSPYLGWRGWYGATNLGWNDRVDTCMSSHLNQIVKKPEGQEVICYDGTKPREGDGPSPYHWIENTYGFLPYYIGQTMAYYDMQECAFDMMLYNIEWAGNFEIVKKYYNDFCEMLNWEERILDPDNDGLYQNFLNTWISDGHSYNGAGCAQASAYNYRANVVMAKIANKLGFSADKFIERAKKIKDAINDTLWLPQTGVIAESIDTVGNCLIHPSPELSTTYLIIDCDAVDKFKAYTMLKYTETDIVNVYTQNSNGRLVYSSNWKPKKYSTYGIFPAENSHLALTYFQLGLKEQGKKILDGLVDCFFTGTHPADLPHVVSSQGTADNASLDFTDVTSTYLRLVVEGLYGIRINTLDEVINIAPNFPSDWNSASLAIKDISLTYNKKGNTEIFDICSERQGKRRIKLPMLSTCVETVLIDGKPSDYQIEAGVNNSFVIVETDKTGRFQLRVTHCDGKLPTVSFSKKVLATNEIVFEVNDGAIAEIKDINQVLEDITIINNKVYAKTKDIDGNFTLFIRVKAGEYDSYIACDYQVVKKDKEKVIYQDGKDFTPIDISKHFNLNMKDVHNQEYLSPRPQGYSIGMFPNGRYAWDWNHKGHNEIYIDDTVLRQANGLVHTQSGIPFITPEQNENLACVSIWDNFPTQTIVDLDGSAKEIAVLFVATTNAMQSHVENARIVVEYEDGSQEKVSLVYPFNFDDWLTPAFQTQNETFYFNHYNHATVQRIKLDQTKKLKNIKIEAVANEVILGVLAISICR